MGARTSGREAALQMLFALDSAQGRKSKAVEQQIADFWREVGSDAEGRAFADELVRAVAADIEAIDTLVSGASRHWRLERMARVDRNVLRLGAHELKSSQEVPRAVVIDEAVELAKRFGAGGSSVFVNGVLDRIAEDLGRAE